MTSPEAKRALSATAVSGLPWGSCGPSARGDALKVAVSAAEIAILGATATTAWSLVASSGNLLVIAPIVVAATAVEAVRLPLVMRIPRLGFLSAVGSLALALALSTLTGETLVLGVNSVLTARSQVACAACRSPEDRGADLMAAQHNRLVQMAAKNRRLAGNSRLGAAAAVTSSGNPYRRVRVRPMRLVSDDGSSATLTEREPKP
jgi:hypothetical protein